MTSMKSKHLLSLVSSLAMILLSSVGWAGGGARPGPNPFESGAGVNLDEWAKSQSLTPLNLVLSSNVAGKLGPCGCSMNPKGGVDRRHNFIESKKTLGGGLLILDAGNALFANRNIDPSLAMKQRERARKIAASQKDLGVEVQNVGVLDLAAGLDFALGLAKSTGLRMISTNLVGEKDNKAPFDVAYVKNVPGLGKVLVVGVTSLPVEGYPGIKALDALDSIKAQVAAHRPKITVVLSDLGQSADMSLMAKISEPLIVLGARDLNAIDIPIHVGESILVQPGIQGQQMGFFRFAAHNKFAAWRNLTQDKALSQRWSQLTEEFKTVQTQDHSTDKKRSLERIRDSFEELSKYARNDLSKSWPYAYELYDMDDRYAQKNKFTKLSLEDQ